MEFGQICQFSLKLVSRHLSSCGNDQNASLYKNIWKGLVPKKIWFLIWEVSHGSTDTTDIIIKKVPCIVCLPLIDLFFVAKVVNPSCTYWSFVTMANPFGGESYRASSIMWCSQMNPTTLLNMLLMAIRTRMRKLSCGLSSSKPTFGLFGMSGITTSLRIEMDFAQFFDLLYALITWCKFTLLRTL